MVKGLKRMACLLLAVMLLAGSAWAEDWVCPGCARQNDAEYNFCPSCGYEPQATACPECGYEMGADVADFKYCPKCKAQLKETAPVEEIPVEDVTIDDTKNTARVTIDGEEHIFYLSNVKVDNSHMNVYYYAFNPRGEYQFKLWIQLAAGAEPGVRFDSNYDRYETLADDVTVVLYTQYHGSYQWTGEYHMGYVGTGEVILELDSRSDDWTTYSGKAAARAVYHLPSAGMPDITLSMEFNYTLGESHPYSDEMMHKEEARHNGGGGLEDIFENIGGGSSDIGSDTDIIAGSDIVPDINIVTFTDPSDDYCFSCGGTGRCKSCDGFGYTYTTNFGNGSYKRDCGLCIDGECKYCW